MITSLVMKQRSLIFASPIGCLPARFLSVLCVAMHSNPGVEIKSVAANLLAVAWRNVIVSGRRGRHLGINTSGVVTVAR